MNVVCLILALGAAAFSFLDAYQFMTASKIAGEMSDLAAGAAVNVGTALIALVAISGIVGLVGGGLSAAKKSSARKFLLIDVLICLGLWYLLDSTNPVFNPAWWSEVTAQEGLASTLWDTVSSSGGRDFLLFAVLYLIAGVLTPSAKAGAAETTGTSRQETTRSASSLGPVSLRKGENISLSKNVPGLKSVWIGLGWDVRRTSGAEFDLDASLFMLGGNGRVRSDADFIFYNNPQSSDGSVVYAGDNRTGAGEGDDEVINVGLTRVPTDVTRLVIVVSIHEAEARGQNFGMVSNAFVRVLNRDTNKEIARYNLSEDGGANTAVILGEIYRHSGEWKFKAVGQGYTGGLGPLARDFGVNIA
jgi:tellurium resistance protein TerD